MEYANKKHDGSRPDPTPDQLAGMQAKINAAKSAKKIGIPAKYILADWAEKNLE